MTPRKKNPTTKRNMHIHILGEEKNGFSQIINTYLLKEEMLCYLVNPMKKKIIQKDFSIFHENLKN